MQGKERKSKEIDLGIRKVSEMNFSEIVTLPKTYTKNYLTKTKTVRMSMSADGTLTLTPVGNKTVNDSDIDGGNKKVSA